MLATKPPLWSLRTSRMRSRSAAMRSLPSVDALSTTTRSSRSAGQSSAASASRHAPRWSAPFQLRTTRRTNGIMAGWAAVVGVVMVAVVSGGVDAGTGRA